MYPPLAGVDPSEWDAIITTRQNVLLCGAPSPIDAALSTLLPHLREPICLWRADTESAPPSLMEGTLILEQATACRRLQQQVLWEWLNEANRRVQVIAVTDQPLFELVQRGAFLPGLYYRLNTLCLTVTGDCFPSLHSRFLESTVPE